MPAFELAGLVLLAGLGWFWLDGLKARDAAIQAARRACGACWTRSPRIPGGTA